MKKNVVGLVVGLLGLLTVACNSQHGGVQSFDMQKIAARYADTETGMKQSDIFKKNVLYVSPEDGNKGVVIWEKVTNRFGTREIIWCLNCMVRRSIVALSISSFIRI